MPRGLQPKRMDEPEELMKAAIAVESASRHAADLMDQWIKNLSVITIEGEGRKLAHSYKRRVKPVTDILGKVSRKRMGAQEGTDDWAYNPHHVTDGCGFRVVVLFQEDILLVVDEIVKLVRHMPPYTDNPVAGLKELVIYTNQHVEDPESLARRIKSRLDAEGGGAGFDKSEIREPENRKGGYSSVHFVLHVNVTGNALGSIPIEIQIRDVFEEAWSEIDHTLRYVNDRESRDGGAPMQTNWRNHLSALKTQADGCSQHASLIKETAIDHLKRQAATGQLPTNQLNQRPSEPPEDVAAAICRVIPDKDSEIRSAFKTLAQASNAADEGARDRLFDEAEQMFALLLEGLPPDVGGIALGDRTLSYHLAMERAFCMQSRQAKSEKQAAVELYRTILSEFPGDAFATYRLGITLRSLGEMNEALASFRKGLELLATDRSVAQDSWLRSALPRQIGFSLWQSHEKNPSDPNAPALLAEAISVTRSALECARALKLNDDEVLMCLNNLVYYIWLREKSNKDSGLTVDGAELSVIAHELLSLLPKDGILTPYLSKVHTLFKTFDLLGDRNTRDAMLNALARGLYEMARARSRQPELPVGEVRQHLPEKMLRIHDEVTAALWQASGACDHKHHT